jgi:hypothetical protein
MIQFIIDHWRNLVKFNTRRYIDLISLSPAPISPFRIYLSRRLIADFTTSPIFPHAIHSSMPPF